MSGNGVTPVFAVVYDHEAVVQKVYPIEGNSTNELEHAGMAAWVAITGEGEVFFDLSDPGLQRDMHRIRVRDPQEPDHYLSPEQTSSVGVVSYGPQHEGPFVKFLGGSESPYFSMAVIRSEAVPEVGCCIGERLR